MKSISFKIPQSVCAFIMDSMPDLANHIMTYKSLMIMHQFHKLKIIKKMNNHFFMVTSEKCKISFNPAEAMCFYLCYSNQTEILPIFEKTYIVEMLDEIRQKYIV